MLVDSPNSYSRRLDVRYAALMLRLKPWLLPNRHLLLQLIHDPLTCSKPFVAMRTHDSQEKRWFSNCDKSNSMVNDNELKPKLVCGLFNNWFQLMLRHLTMRLVVDSLDFTAVLKSPYHSPKLDHRSCIAIVVF